jgi:hypothetical protein
MIVVISVIVDVRMHKRRVHGTGLYGHSQTEGENPTNHVTIVYQNH